MWSRLVANPRRGLQVLGLFLLMLGVGALALPSLGRMDIRGVSILDVELMRTSARAAEVLDRLGPDGIDAARLSIYLDFPFLVSYAAALTAACVVLAARASRRGSPKIAAAGQYVAWAAPVAAVCDVVENVALLVVLDGSTGQPWPVLAFVFASAKFVLLGATVVYLLVAVVTDWRAAVAAANQPAN